MYSISIFFEKYSHYGSILHIRIVLIIKETEGMSECDYLKQ